MFYILRRLDHTIRILYSPIKMHQLFPHTNVKTPLIKLYSHSITCEITNKHNISTKLILKGSFI